MSSFNINNVPDSIVGKVYWSVAGLKVLWGRVVAATVAGVTSFNTRTGAIALTSSDVTTALGQVPPVCLFDHYTSVGNVGTDETDLYSDIIVANTLAANGDKLEFMYSGTFDTSATKQLKVYMGINVLLDSTAIAQDTGYWTVSGTIIRKSISVIRSTVKCDMYTNAGLLTSGSSYSFTLETNTDSDTDNILKITGQAGGDGAGDNDIIATMGTVTWISHA